MRLLILILAVALPAGSSSVAAEQEPSSIPLGTEKAIQKAILWLQQHQQPNKQPRSETEKAIQKSLQWLEQYQQPSKGPLSNTERVLEAIQKAARDQRLSHKARGLGAWADEVQVDLKAAREIVVGNTRVVLLQVRRTIDFTDAGADTASRAVTSVRIVYLMEYVGDKSVEVVSQGAEVFAAGTTEPALLGDKGTAKAPSELKTESYSGYRNRFAATEPQQAVARLPKVKDANKAVVAIVTFDDVAVTAPKVDLRLACGLLKGEEERRVLFRNVPLE